MMRSSGQGFRVTAYDVTLAATSTGRTELAGALAALSDPRDWTTHSRPKRPHAIAIARVLSEAWRADRLERSSERLIDGEQAPPISVVRYRLHGRSWYSVSDGNHRTEAARNAGRTHIRAQIGGTYGIDLDAYVVRREFEDERLYRRDPDDATRYRLVLEMNDTTAATIERIGVRRAHDIAPKLSQVG